MSTEAPEPTDAPTEGDAEAPEDEASETEDGDKA